MMVGAACELKVLALATGLSPGTASCVDGCAFRGTGRLVAAVARRDMTPLIAMLDYRNAEKHTLPPQPG